MTDALLAWNDELGTADLSLVDADLTSETGLRTALIISLFSDRRARPDDVLPQVDGDPRGWWGDYVATEDDDQIGSRLWLLSREKQTPETAERAREYCVEALGWLLRDGVAAAVEIETSWVARGVLGISVQIIRPGGPGRERYDFVWKALTQ